MIFLLDVLILFLYFFYLLCLYSGIVQCNDGIQNLIQLSFRVLVLLVYFVFKLIQVNLYIYTLS